MYYPARIQQMAMNRHTDTKDLFQLMNYYNDVYTMLLGQAQRQTALKVAMDESVLYELTYGLYLWRRRTAPVMEECGKTGHRVSL